MTVTERIDQMCTDLKALSAQLASTDDIKAAIMFLSAVEMIGDAHQQADHLQDQDWDDYLTYLTPSAGVQPK